jgi:hypothetical protein
LSETPVTVSFLVPLCDDATRVAHGDTFWTALETGVIDRFGGFTRHADVTGAWRDGAGNIVREPSRCYETDVPSARVPEALSFLSAVCAVAGQQCLR